MTGLGDRLRGIMYTLRAAAAAGRVLLIDILDPLPIEHLLMPSAIDWRMSGIQIPDDAIIWRAPVEPERRIEALEKNTAYTLQDKFLVMIGINTWHSTALVGSPDVAPVGRDAHCMHRALFQPSETVKRVSFAAFRTEDCSKEGGGDRQYDE